MKPLVDESSKTCKINKLFEDILDIDSIKIRRQNEAEEIRYIKTMAKGNSRFHDFASILTSTISQMGINYGSYYAGVGLYKEEKKDEKSKENPDKKNELRNTQKKKSDSTKYHRALSVSFTPIYFGK